MSTSNACRASAGMIGSSLPTHMSTDALMRRLSSDFDDPSPGWKPTTARRSAPVRASSSAIAPPKQNPMAATRVGSVSGWASSTSSPARAIARVRSASFIISPSRSMADSIGGGAPPPW